MATITDSKKHNEVTAVLIKTVKTYVGISLLVILATVPTKAVYLIVQYLWGLF